MPTYLLKVKYREVSTIEYDIISTCKDPVAQILVPKKEEEKRIMLHKWILCCLDLIILLSDVRESWSLHRLMKDEGAFSCTLLYDVKHLFLM